MNPCIYTQFITIKEEDLERSMDIGIPPEEYWTDYSFKIYNVESYYRAYEGDNEVGVTINFISGEVYTVKLSFEKMKELEEEYYNSETHNWLTKVN